MPPVAAEAGDAVWAVEDAEFEGGVKVKELILPSESCRLAAGAPCGTVMPVPVRARAARCGKARTEPAAGRSQY